MLNSNYLNIYKKKENNHSFIGKIVDASFKNIKLSKRQKILSIIAVFSLGVSFLMKLSAQVGGIIGIPPVPLQPINSVITIMNNKFGSEVHADIIKDIASNWAGLNIVKMFLEYMSDVQLASIKVINDLPFGQIDMFDHIVNGLTIFAIIGCLYRLIMHFLNTERFDNVKAITGFFNYIGIALLFIFSDQIVDRVVSLNEPIKAEEMKKMSSSLNAELDRVILNDLEGVIKEINRIEQEQERIRSEEKEATFGLSEKIEILKNEMTIWKLKVFDGNYALIFKYIYYTIFTMLISSIMAIPGFIISVMVKVLLTVMVAGTKLVFLLAFIPGFENTWKTFMLNMLNILLWIPIFNALYGFIVTLIIELMSDNTLGSGQVVWLSIVAIILAFQSISLTTTAAGVVINGAGASMAGAMGAISSMSGASMAMGVAKTAVGATASIAGGAIGTSIGASTLGKYMQK